MEQNCREALTPLPAGFHPLRSDSTAQGSEELWVHSHCSALCIHSEKERACLSHGGDVGTVEQERTQDHHSCRKRVPSVNREETEMRLQ